MIAIEQTTWQRSCAELRAIRASVFIDEQKVPKELEWDGLDETAIHVLAFLITNHLSENPTKTPVGTARMLADGHIGRMAVLKPYRNQRVGSSMISHLLGIAESQKLDRVYLHAQVSAIHFYEKQAFNIVSKQFMDAGIPHVTMEKMI